MQPIYVSFHTGFGYAAESRELVNTLDAFGLEHDVREIPDSGEWEVNCSRKASYLLAMRAAHPGRALAWVDADARVRKTPTVFHRLDCDFAANWGKRGDELRSGTLYFGDTPGATELLEAWQHECTLNPTKLDQQTLQDLFVGRHFWRLDFLPIEYTAIFDEGVETPVIEHMQASRRYRR